ncbi:MAG: TolC family protein [Acidiferrobacterales bacterium]
MSIMVFSCAPRRLRSALIAFLVLFMLSPPAWSSTLTVDGAIREAMQNNLELRAALHSVDIARARLVQSGLWPNPRLEIGRTTDTPFRDQGENSTSVALSQDLPIAGRLSKRKDVARVDVELALAEVSDAERKLAGEVADTFYGLVGINKQIEVRDRLIAIDEQLVKTTQDRYKAAEVSELDVNTAALELQRLAQERIDLEIRRTTLGTQLNQLLGRPAGTPVGLDDTLPSPASLPNLADLQRKAIESRPDLHSVVLNVDRAYAEEALASASRWDDWTISLGEKRERLVVDGAPPQSTDKVLMLTLSVPLPLFNRNQGNVAAAQAFTTQATESAGALKLRIEAEVANAYQEVQRLEGVLVSYTGSMLPLSERNAKLAQQAYRQGQIPIIGVVQAQRQQSDLNIAYLNVLNQYLKARVRLATATDTYATYATHAKEASSTDIAGH